MDDLLTEQIQLSFDGPFGAVSFLQVKHRPLATIVETHILLSCSYTDIGLASTPDNGTTWIYRGAARGLDVPLAMRHDMTNLQTQQFGGATVRN